MRIDYDNVARFADKTNSNLKVIDSVRCRLADQRLRLASIDESDVRAASLMRIEKELDEYLTDLLKFKKAVVKISEIFTSGEEAVRSAYENENSLGKTPVGVFSVINEKTDFEWNIK